jgi:hypothetical protein
MFLGGQPAAAPFVICSKIFTVTYFSYLILLIPLMNLMNDLTFGTNDLLKCDHIKLSEQLAKEKPIKKRKDSKNKFVCLF